MSRFDLYKARVGDGYVLDLQTDLLEVQSTRMVAPVLPADQVARRIKTLHPEVEVNGKPFVMATHLMAAVPKTALQNPVANLADHADDITRALDLLFQGY